MGIVSYKHKSLHLEVHHGSIPEAILDFPLQILNCPASASNTHLQYKVGDTVRIQKSYSLVFITNLLTREGVMLYSLSEFYRWR